ncbi:phage head closure protein [Streptomyces sp. 3MP-14]|uniref:Phage head closure protein n=1 Tax=Streptomyces mimosae TaxID=2586635 RepID=A0A5N6AHP3_9ACTN|nr:MULTISPECIES: phage head closure protein [Streptomyces]KAB8167058.1 phage head closure protein [Streptomyces mimosae]KAB8176999.1 phage head closure protein [Streptomyces sp. 3MP-14]
MDITHLLNRHLAVWRQTTAPDGAGGQTVTWAQAGEVAAKVDQPSTRERVVAQQAGSEHTHTVYTLPGADVRRGDQLRDGGERYRVLSIISPSTPIYRRADVHLIQTEGEPP